MLGQTPQHSGFTTRGCLLSGSQWGICPRRALQAKPLGAAGDTKDAVFSRVAADDLPPPTLQGAWARLLGTYTPGP
jgi:hypothetical protein